MKFSENLQKLRKEANLSQEALAEKLGVTRQSVSKWESGSSYPEMDKLISMCSLFDCSMDYLLNGTETKEQHEKFTVNNLVNELTTGAEKTVKMLSEKDGKGIIKFILELIIIFFIIMLFKIPVNIFESFVNNIFDNLGSLGDVFSVLWTVFLELAYLVLAVLFFVMIYKTRYLDNYEEKQSISRTINEKCDEKNKEVEDSFAKEKISKEHKEGGIISFLASILMLFIKFIAICILAGFAIECMTAIVLFAFSIIIFIEGVHIFGPIIGLLGLVIFSIVISELLFNFISNHKNNMKKTFISFVISFLLMGFGISMTIYSFSNMTYVDGLPNNYKKETIIKEIDMNNDIIFTDYFVNDHLKFIEDDNLKNIKIEADEYKGIYDYEIQNYNNNISFVRITSSMNGSEITKEIIRNLKNKTIYNYNIEYSDSIRVYASKANIDVLKKNIENYHNKIDSNDSEISNLESEIDRLRDENEELTSANETLKEEMESLKEKNKELVERITDALSE